ncbi:MAG: protein-disulfide reductase DsbD family protein [Chlamydiales bacterium]|nr:protein-disulfide reductase DsbD family protein [Chlamydiales bacterium]
MFARLLSLSAVGLFFLAAPLLADHKQDDSNPVSVQIVSEDVSIHEGDSFWLAVHLDVQPHWHTYWKNPGDTGSPLQVSLDLPEGFILDEILWPVPKHFVQDGLSGLGFEDTITLLAKVTPPSHLSIQEAKMQAHVQWVVCGEQCIPGEQDLEITLPVKESAPVKDEHNTSVFSDARSHLPEKGKDLSVQVAHDHLLLNFSLLHEHSALESAVFYPEEIGITDLSAKQQLTKVDNGYQLKVPLLQPLDQNNANLKGILKGSFTDHAKQTFLDVNVPLKGMENSSSISIMTFSFALLGAFAGGLLLNLMPCVLPVLSLKVLSVVQAAGDSARERLRQGLAYVVGVMLSFWVLAGLLLAFRASGQELGWGFQLQEPIFVGVLIILLFLMSLNLFGVFEFGTSLVALDGKKKSPSLMGAFSSGVLATVVATPCTGPFLGASLGFAMTLPALQAFGLFSIMGLGMAIPFFLLTVSPKLLKILPKPGAWMVLLKQAMGFILLASVLWLVWVWEAQTNFLSVMFLFFALLILGIGAWFYGHFSQFSYSKMMRRVALVVASITLGVALYTVSNESFALQETSSGGNIQNTSSSHALKAGWIPYSEEKFKELQAEGKPVFIDFTAKWCLICQANKVVLHSQEVEDAFNQAGIVRMEADWTKGDPAITKRLKEFNRSGVPFYVLYGKSAEAPQIFSETLTSNTLIEASKKV